MAVLVWRILKRKTQFGGGDAKKNVRALPACIQIGPRTLLQRQDHIFDIERECGLDDSNNIIFALFPDDSGAWCVNLPILHTTSVHERFHR
jgi:hypothetical protein